MTTGGQAIWCITLKPVCTFTHNAVTVFRLAISGKFALNPTYGVGKKPAIGLEPSFRRQQKIGAFENHSNQSGVGKVQG